MGSLPTLSIFVDEKHGMKIILYIYRLLFLFVCVHSFEDIIRRKNTLIQYLCPAYT